MDHHDTITYHATGLLRALGAAAASYWGSLPGSLRILLVAMTFDLALFLVRAWKLRPEEGRSFTYEAVIKCGMLMITYLAYAMQREMGIAEIAPAVAGWFAVRELLGVLRKAAAIGVPVPRAMVQALERKRGEVEGSEK